MDKAISETNRRRAIQAKYNEEHGITPKTVKRAVKGGLQEVYGYDSGENTVAGKMAALEAKAAEYAANPTQIGKEIKKLRKQMKKAAEKLEFEQAAKIRDEIKRLELIELGVLSGEVEDVSHKFMDET
jgi:excinuclease ABC subunit B